MVDYVMYVVAVCIAFMGLISAAIVFLWLLARTSAFLCRKRFPDDDPLFWRKR